MGLRWPAGGSDSEDSEEPSLQTIINTLFNYKTQINSTISPTYQPTAASQPIGEEVISPYWKAANASQSVTVTDLASWHLQGNPVSVGWFPKSPRTLHHLFTTSGVEGQSFLPHLEGDLSKTATGSFKPGAGTFGFQIDYERSVDSLNPPGGFGHHVRFFPIRDHLGNLLPNAYFMCLDYSPGTGSSGENFDYQDQIYVVTNVKPG